jgi:hypothetical protein
MGQKQSTLVYSPLEFVNYKEKYPLTSLEDFLVYAMEAKLGIKAEGFWQPLLAKIGHKIRCISEGWTVRPKIIFEIFEHEGAMISRVVKIMDAV